MRGRGGSRGRGRGSLRGGYSSRGGRGRDYYSSSYERGGQGTRRSDRQPLKSVQKSDDGEENERDYDGKAPLRQRHSPADDLSDVSADDNLGVFNDNAVNDKTHDKETENEKDQDQRDSKDSRQQRMRPSDQNRDVKPIREHKNAWHQEPKPQQGPPPPPLQNAWTKNQPLLPDPPKTEWTPEDSAPKGDEEAPKVDVWQQRQDSRDSGVERTSGENHAPEPVDRRHDGNRKDDRDNFRRQDREGGRRGDRDRNRNDGFDGEYKDRRDRDRYRDKRGDHDSRHDEQNGMFVPRGEPSRRGRGKKSTFF